MTPGPTSGHTASVGEPVSPLADQLLRRREPPGLEGELGQLVTVDAVEVDHHPAEPVCGELHLEDLRPLRHQGSLLGDRLLEADGPRGFPEVAEGARGDLESGVAGVLDRLDVVELSDELEELRDRGHAGTTSATHSTWCVIGNTFMRLSVSAIVCEWLHPSGQTGL